MLVGSEGIWEGEGQGAVALAFFLIHSAFITPPHAGLGREGNGDGTCILHDSRPLAGP